MNIREIVYFVTKTTRHEVVISAEEGYIMPKTAKGLVDLVTTINNNPSKELAWSTSTVIDDTMVIDDYEIKEVEQESTK